MINLATVIVGKVNFPYKKDDNPKIVIRLLRQGQPHARKSIKHST